VTCTAVWWNHAARACWTARMLRHRLQRRRRAGERANTIGEDRMVHVTQYAHTLVRLKVQCVRVRAHGFDVICVCGGMGIFGVDVLCYCACLPARSAKATTAYFMSIRCSSFQHKNQCQISSTCYLLLQPQAALNFSIAPSCIKLHLRASPMGGHYL